MTRGRALVLALGALLLVAGALVVASRRSRLDYKPIVAGTALDRWRAPWASEGTARAGLPRRWIVMGWDGAAWDIVLPLLEAGRLPHLAALMREGSYGELLTFKPTQSAAVWTTIATGVSPLRHAIEGFARPPGGLRGGLGPLFGLRQRRTQLSSNADRRVKALWNLVSEQGRPVMVVGYHNTFPAEKVAGLMVSNYLVRQATMTAIPGAKPEDPGTLVAHLAYPPAALRRIAGLNRRIEDVRWEEVRRFADVDPQRFEAMMARYRKTPHADARWEYLLKAYAYDEFHGRVALAFRDEIQPEFLFLHFQGPDWADHHFLYFHDPERFAALPGVKAMMRKLAPELPRYRKTVAAFYEHADEWLGRLLEGGGPATGVMVLSDHGVEASSNPGESGTHNDGPPGLVVLSGPGIRRGERIHGATVYDILPTLMAASGLPVARDLPGRVLADAFEMGRVSDARAVFSYESGKRYQPQVELGAELHEELEKELRGLGYIQ